MIERGIQKVVNQEIRIANGPLTLLGDPGCDGLGAATMSIFASALQAAGQGTAIILGDIVHRGIRSLYASVCSFVDTVAGGSVYMVCGNHDSAHYEEYFGCRNYLLYNDNYCYIILDDSSRSFSADALAFLDSVLPRYGKHQLVVLFHIPPPNPVDSNTISLASWEQLLSRLEPHRAKVALLACGHVHSWYRTTAAGYPLVVSGGAGARIEFVSDQVLPHEAVHHVVSVAPDASGRLAAQQVLIATHPYTRELQDEELRQMLETSLQSELVAHLQYRLYAELAAAQALPRISDMFRAFSEAEYYHARNHWYALGKQVDLETALEQTVASESHEIEVMYHDFLEYARQHQHGLSAYSFMDALEAEKTHLRYAHVALDALRSGSDSELGSWHTCSSCGYTFHGEGHPAHCPVCGAPADKILPLV